MKNFDVAAPLGRWVAGGMLAALGSIGSAQAQGPTFVSLSPVANAASAAPTGLTAQFGVAPALAPTAGQGLKVFSSQRGGQRAGHSGTVSNLTNTQLRFTPTGYDFRPGETVQVSLTRGIIESSFRMAPLTNPAVVQYTTATGGTGRGAYLPGPDVPAAANPNYVRLADFNNDGHLDALVFTGSSLAAALHLGTGTGAFGAGTALPAVGLYPSGTLAVGDLDNDGDLDVVQTDGGSSGTLQTLRNNGSGTFTAAPATAVNFGAQRLALGDIDGDGDLDAVLNGEQSGLVNIRRNDGTGVFDNPNYPGGVQLPNLHNVIDVALADVDNDYDLDIVTLAGQGNAGAMSVELNVLLNGGDASGSNTGTFSTNAGAVNSLTVGLGQIQGRTNILAVGDVDNDGDLDLAVALNGITAIPVGVVLLNGSGTGSAATTALGTFGASRPVALAPITRDLALADVDADGDLDVLSMGADVATGTTGSLCTAYNAGTGTFAAPVRRAALGAGTNSMAVADLDHDGDLDVLAANYTAGTLSVRLNGPGPEINITQSGTSYASGSTYDFGTVAVGTSSGRRFFTIENLSTTDDLTITGQTTTISAGTTFGSSSSGFPYVIPPGGSLLLIVEINPFAAGPQSATLTLANDDVDEPAYLLNFVVNQAAPAACTWTGAVSTDWATAGNWNPAAVPGATTDVTIPVTTRQPLVSAAGATCANLSSAVGSSLAIAAPGYLTVTENYRTAGATAMTGGTLEVTGNDVFFNGGLNATGGLVRLSGAGTQIVGTTTGGYCTFWNLTVAARASSLVFAFPLAVRRVLTLAANLDPNGGLRLLSDASGTAMIVNQGGRVQSAGTMQRYVGGPNAGLGYRHISSHSSFNSAGNFYGTPFALLLNPAYNTVGNTVQPFPNFFGYDEARQGAAGVPGPVGFDQGWFSPATVNTALGAGRGSTVQLSGGSTLNHVGDFNTGPVAVGALSRSGSGPFAGYHLLGNPYPAPIAWGNVAKPAGLDDAVYVFRSTGQYSGFYDFYANGLGTLAGGEIAAMQGFFVRVSQPVAAFTFTDAARLTTYSNPTFRRGAADTRPVLALALRPASGPAAAEADKTFVYFEAGATAGLDARYDAGKLPNPGGLGLASQTGGQDYALNGLPPLGAAPLLVPLTVAAPAPGRYELAAEQVANFAPGTRLWLRDALLGTRTLLTPGTRYAFALAGTSAPGRFAVEFGAAGALATAAQVLAAQVAVWPNPVAGAGFVTVAAPAGATVAVLDALGRVLRPVLAVGAGGTVRVSMAGLTAGVYVVQVRGAAGAVVTRRLLVE